MKTLSKHLHKKVLPQLAGRIFRNLPRALAKRSRRVQSRETHDNAFRFFWQLQKHIASINHCTTHFSHCFSQYSWHFLSLQITFSRLNYSSFFNEVISAVGAMGKEARPFFPSSHLLHTLATAKSSSFCLVLLGK